MWLCPSLASSRKIQEINSMDWLLSVFYLCWFHKGSQARAEQQNLCRGEGWHNIKFHLYEDGWQNTPLRSIHTGKKYAQFSLSVVQKDLREVKSVRILPFLQSLEVSQNQNTRRMKCSRKWYDYVGGKTFSFHPAHHWNPCTPRWCMLAKNDIALHNVILKYGCFINNIQNRKRSQCGLFVLAVLLLFGFSLVSFLMRTSASTWISGLNVNLGPVCQITMWHCLQ